MKRNHITLKDLKSMPPHLLSAISTDDLALLQEEAVEAAAALKSQLALLDMVKANKYEERAAQDRRAKGKHTGTVRLIEGDYEVVCDLPKKVEWDQDKLRAALDALPPATAQHYAKVEIKVEEKKFDAAPPDVQTALAVARTVKTGKPTFKFERKENQKAA